RPGGRGSFDLVRSMTGYGRGLAEREGRRAVVEIRTVNHRFMDVKLRGVPLDAALEEKVTSRVRERITRGSVTVAIRLDGAAASSSLRVDQEAARRIHAELRQLAVTLQLEPRISLDLIASQPGVLVPMESDRSSDALGECVVEAIDRALEGLVAMREVEGNALARDLVARFDVLRGLGDGIDRLARSAPEDAERRLRDRLGRLLASGKVAVDEARLAQEVAILADRMDVTEELVRVASHIAQLGELLRMPHQAVGRRLDFLVQELGREFNTVASKSQSAEIARLVVEAKAELEKVREQVQNVE
ncbi:MAG TPA: YicC/YloC family endoribonuclease, partial [Kofleriaceae bacterium]|nr:YicC/YloC family endoribonuclease [Kofleriaceae bacterium]